MELYRSITRATARVPFLLLIRYSKPLLSCSRMRVLWSFFCYLIIQSSVKFTALNSKLIVASQIKHGKLILPLMITKYGNSAVWLTPEAQTTQTQMPLSALRKVLRYKMINQTDIQRLFKKTLRVSLICVTLVFGFVILWTPYHIHYIIVIFFRGENQIAHLY